MPAFDGHLLGADQPCFGCSPRHPIGFRAGAERLLGGPLLEEWARFTR